LTGKIHIYPALACLTQDDPQLIKVIRYVHYTGHKGTVKQDQLLLEVMQLEGLTSRHKYYAMQFYKFEIFLLFILLQFSLKAGFY
jgi:hypothetical protein